MTNTNNFLYFLNMKGILYMDQKKLKKIMANPLLTQDFISMQYHRIKELYCLLKLIIDSGVKLPEYITDEWKKIS